MGQTLLWIDILVLLWTTCLKQMNYYIIIIFVFSLNSCLEVDVFL